MDSVSKLSKLIALHLAGMLDEAGESELAQLLEHSEKDRDVFLQMSRDTSLKESYLQYKNVNVKQAIRDFNSRTRQKRFFLYGRKWIQYSAAAVVLFAAMLLLWIVDKKPEREEHVPGLTHYDLSPGYSKAILKLAYGEELEISSTEGVIIDSLSGLELSVSDGELVYPDRESSGLGYNELILPKGGEYRVVLSDGTAVHLNSGSTLKYPVYFSGDCREVELSGEAYFDVMTDPERPFRVKTGGLIISAYGTAFNINTQQPGYIRTALVNGKVGIRTPDSKEEVMLQPDQLAEYRTESCELEIREVDISLYTAWTDGWFIFQNESLEHILTTLGLWYDFEVCFEHEKVRDARTSGSLKRYERVDDILESIAYTTGVEIRQEGRLLVIGNKK